MKSPNKHMQRAGTHKVLGRGRLSLVPWSAPRARTYARTMESIESLLSDGSMQDSWLSPGHPEARLDESSA
jgi:hypothetical protein